jgi:hypothetical protein
MSNKVQHIIEGAYKLLSHPERHTKGAFARNKKGYPCEIGSTAAFSFCLSGALHKSGEALQYPSPVFAYASDLVSAALLPSRGHRDKPTFNDHPKTTHADVLEVLRKAYKLAENWEEA